MWNIAKSVKLTSSSQKFIKHLCYIKYAPRVLRSFTLCAMLICRFFLRTGDDASLWRFMGLGTANLCNRDKAVSLVCSTKHIWNGKVAVLSNVESTSLAARFSACPRFGNDSSSTVLQLYRRHVLAWVTGSIGPLAKVLAWAFLQSSPMSHTTEHNW